MTTSDPIIYHEPMSISINQLVARFANRLRYPYLFVLLLLLFLVDLVIPDAIPFVDEALLALLTVLVGSWGNRRPTGPAQDDRDDTTEAPPPSAADTQRRSGHGSDSR